MVLGKGYKALVDLLTNEKHEVRLKDHQGRSLLEVAIKNKRESIVILLLTKGADSDEQPSWLLNGSLARIAVENHHLNILKLLLHRSIVNQRIPLSKETLLHRAARNGSVESM